jgi:LAO/AO transport system kinase
MKSNHSLPPDPRGQELFNSLGDSLAAWEKAVKTPGCEHYAAFLHGQIEGLAQSLRVFYPGPGNWGEKAALAVRPLLTEHRCDCGEH